MLLLISVILTVSGASAENLPHFDGKSHYSVNVILDVERKFFVATERISWINSSSVSTNTLIFELPWNAIPPKPDKKSGIRDRLLSFVGEYDSGSISIEKVSILNGPEITKFLNSSGVESAQGEILLSLPGRIGPGEILELEIEYKAKIPERFGSSGYSGDFAVISDWYPRIIGFLSDSSELLSTESALKSYTVQITLPNEITPAATGELRNKVRNGLHTTYTFSQDNVADFVWAFDSDFSLFSRTLKQGNNDDIHVSLFMQPNREHEAEKLLNVIEEAIISAESCFGRYINQTFTVVDVPINLTHIKGLDYHTFVTVCSSRMSGLMKRDPVADIVLGIGAQYLLSTECSNHKDMIVAEAIRLYAESKVYYAVSKLDEQTKNIFSVESLNSDFLNIPYCKNIFNLGPENFCIADNKSFHAMRSGGELICTPAIKGALFFKTYENIVGSVNADNLIRRISDSGTAEGIYARLNSRFHEESWAEMFDTYVFGDFNFDITVVAPDEHSPAFIKTGNGHEDGATFHIRKNSDISIPIEILIEYENGDTSRELWVGESLEKTFIVESGNIKTITVDPDNKLSVDSNRINNRLDFKASSETKVNWLQLIVSWLQNVNQSIVMLF